MSINVLYISYDGMTDPLGQSQVIPYLAGLTKQGYSFTILSCEKPEKYKAHKDTISAVLSASGISWQPILYTKKPPVLSTLYDYYQLKRKAQQLNKQLHFKLVHCRSYIPALLGLGFKRKYGIPFIFDMRGFWADERVDGGLWDLKNPVFKTVYNYFKRKETDFLNESASIVALTDASKAEILTWNNIKINIDKISIIPCCVDIDLFDPGKIEAAEQRTMKLKLDINNDELILGYLGSIGTWYLLDEMMQYFAALKKEVATAKLLFITGAQVNEIQASAQKNGINVADLIITEAARNDVPLMISLFNYSLFFIKPSYSKMASSPTKQGELMAMGVPVICNAGVGDTDNIINKYKSGLLVTDWKFNLSIQQIKEGIKYDKDDIRAGAINYFSLEKGVQAYSEIYNQLLQPKTGVKNNYNKASFK